MKLKLLSSFLALLVGLSWLSGCASAPSKSDELAVNAAKEEAHRRGWQRVEVARCRFQDGFWWVCVYKQPLKVAGNTAWVQVAPDGTVVQFSVNLK